MGKLTGNKAKSEKKNYSFTGHRIINDNKSIFIKSNNNSESNNTTEEMMKILDTDTKQPPQTNMNQMGMNQMGMNQMDIPSMGTNQMGMNQMGMNQMGMNQMDIPSMGTNQMGMNQIGMNQMGMNQMGMNQMGMNQMNMMGAQPGMEPIDPLMVNTLAPINNASMNINTNTLISPMQMANNMGHIANLSKLSNVSPYGGNLTGTEQNPTEQNPGGNFVNPMNQQLNGILNNNMSNMNQMNSTNFKNLAGLHSISKMY